MCSLSVPDKCVITVLGWEEDIGDLVWFRSQHVLGAAMPHLPLPQDERGWGETPAHHIVPLKSQSGSQGLPCFTASTAVSLLAAQQSH